MSKQLLFYGNVESLNKNKHRDLYVKTGNNYAFAGEINSVPLMAVEFPLAAMEYPLVFAGEDDAIIPVAVLGSNQNQNQFINDEHHWQAKYIPAYVRRYPFVFASSDDGKTLTLCIDEQFEGCNRDGKGERLFDDDGEQTLYLSNILRFMEEYQAHFNRTRQFCKKLQELDLLEPVVAQFKNADGAQRSLSGMKAINREKLKALEPEQLAELARNDSLEMIYLHLQSMRNFNVINEREAATNSTAA